MSRRNRSWKFDNKNKKMFSGTKLIKDGTVDRTSLSAGTYGASSTIPVLTVNSAGEITAISNQATVNADTLGGLSSGSFIRSNETDNVGAHTEWQDNYEIRLGTSADFRIWFNGTDTFFRNYAHSGGDIVFQGEDSGGQNENLLLLDTSSTAGFVRLYQAGAERLRTISSGVAVADGTIAATSPGQLALSRSNDNPFISFHTNSGSRIGYIQQAGTDTNDPFYIENETAGTILTLKNDMLWTADFVPTGDIRGKSQIRAAGWWNNASSDENGLAFEIGVSSDEAYAISYNRTSSSYGVMNLNATSFKFNNTAYFDDNIHVGQYIYHKDDSNTYIRMQDDDLQLVAGGRQMIRMNEGTDPDRLFFVGGSSWTDSAEKWYLAGDVVVGGTLENDNGSRFLDPYRDGRHLDSNVYFSITEDDTTATVQHKFGNTNITRVSDSTAPAQGCFEVDAVTSPIFGDYIKVDDETEIIFEFYAKFQSGSDTDARIYAGGQFYDSTKTSLGNVQRYWAQSATSLDSNSNTDWRYYRGVLRGRGSSTGQVHNSAEWMRLLFLFNYQGAGNVTRFCGLRVFKGRQSVSTIYRTGTNRTNNTTEASTNSVVMDTNGKLFPQSMRIGGTATKIEFDDNSSYVFATGGSYNWGLYWDTDTNQMKWRGAGTERGHIDLDNGNVSVTGTLTVTGVSTFNSDINVGTIDVSGQVEIGGEVILKESTERADLLQISSSTSGWAGLQIRNSSDEGRWSFMTNGTESGIYDDENNKWGAKFTENLETELFHNGELRLQTLTNGVGVTGLTVGDVDANPHNAGGLQVSMSGDEKIVLSGSSNPFIRFQEGTGDKAYIQWNNGGFLDFRNQENGVFKFQSTADGNTTSLVLLRQDTTTASGNDLGSINFGHTDGTPDFPTQTIAQLPGRIVVEATETTGTGDDGARMMFFTKPNDADKATDSVEAFRLNHNKEATFYGALYMPSYIYHAGDTNTYMGFSGEDAIAFSAGGTSVMNLTGSAIDMNRPIDMDVPTNTSNPIHITQNIDNGNASYNGYYLDANISGSTAATADRSYNGIRIDIDSSYTGGDTSNEGRLYGTHITVNNSGDNDIINGGYFFAQNSGTEAGTLTQTTAMYGVYGFADNNRSGLIASQYGGHFLSYVDNAGATATVNTTNSYAVYGKHLQSTGGTSGTTTTARGGYFEVECDEGVVTNAYGVQSNIDRDGGTISNGTLYYGSYSGTVGVKHGLYLTGDSYNSVAGSLTVLNGLTVGDSGSRTAGPHNADGIQILSTNDEKMVLSGSTQPYIRWQEGTADKAFIRWLSDGQLQFNNQESGTFSFESNATSTAVNIKFQASDADLYGSVYGTHSNEMGFLDQDGNWTIRCIRDDEVRIADNNITQVAIGAGATGMGDYGTMTTGTTDGKGGYEGYGIGNRFVFMSSSTTLCGIYNDANNEWCSQYRANAEVRLYHNGTEKFRTRSDGCQSNAFFYSSDERLKENIVTIDDSINKIKQLRGVEYDWKKSGKRDIGVIAQEVEKVIPEVVSTVDGKDEYVVEYGHMVGLLIEGIKEQQKEIDELKMLVKQLLEKK